MKDTKIKNLSNDEVKALRDEVTAKLGYDATTGEFRWKYGETIAAKVRGMKAGHVQRAGYLTIRLGGRLYYGQRLAWLVSYGVWPMVPVEFVDRNKANTAIANLVLKASGNGAVKAVSAGRLPAQASGLTIGLGVVAAELVPRRALGIDLGGVDVAPRNDVFAKLLAEVEALGYGDNDELEGINGPINF